MTPNQLYPLEVNPKTQEPFLRLRKHKNVILTPMRFEDAPHFVPLFNDPRIYDWLMKEWWMQENKPTSDAILQELNDAKGSDTLKVVGGAPIGAIRQGQEDRTENFLGNLDITRCFNPELSDTDTVDWEHSEEKDTANKKLDVGDPRIVWCFEVITDAVETLLQEWAIPRMNVRKIITGTFTGNQASVRVFEKNGFVLSCSIAEHSLVRGKMRGLHILEWKLDTDAWIYENMTPTSQLPYSPMYFASDSSLLQLKHAALER